MNLLGKLNFRHFKFHIILSSIILFFLGVGQIYLISAWFDHDVVAEFFLIQAFTVFAIALGGSSITIKTLVQLDADKPIFNVYPLFHQFIFTLGAFTVITLSPIASLEFNVWTLAMLLCAVNCNSSIVAFLRSDEKTFVSAQYCRVGITSIRLALIVSLASEVTVSDLLYIFLYTDFLYTVFLLIYMFRRKHLFELELNSYANKIALVWGSVNASLRNIPRLLVFTIVSEVYPSSAIVALRLYLVPREHLVSLMGIINTAFFKEIFKGNVLVLAVALFGIAFVFQVIVFSFLLMSGTELEFSFQVILFYISAASMYAISQYHWRLIEKNKESIQVAIHLISICVMALFFWVSSIYSFYAVSVSYLSVFYFTWTGLVLFCSLRKERGLVL